MATPLALVLRSPGANCDEETAEAFRMAGADAERIHVNRLLESPDELERFQILCVPGGFSYGDDIAAGRVLGNQVRARLSDACQRFRDDGKLILGICNGFQVLAQTGLLDLEDEEGPLATLTWNDHGRYEARWVHLSVQPGECVFMQGLDRIELPIAHAEGKIAVRDTPALQRLGDEGRLVIRYGDEETTNGEELPFPQNPNGSIANAAGLCDPSGRVMGLMPHPERYLYPTQHPSWTRSSQAGNEGAGLQIFKNAVRYFG